MVNKESFLPYQDGYTALLSSEEAQGSSSLAPFRKKGWSFFETLGWPDRRHEEWKYTSLQNVLAIPFAPARPDSAPAASFQDLQRLTGSFLPASRLVFVNGFFSSELSSFQNEGGVSVLSFASALKTEGPLKKAVIKALEAHAASRIENPFEALNLALASDGIVLSIDEGTFLSEPISFLHLNLPTASPSVAFPRFVIHVGPHAQVSLLERYLTSPEGPTLTAATTQIFVGENAQIDTTKLQEEAPTAFHFSQTLVTQARHSRFSNLYVGLGGSLARQEIRVHLDGEATETTLNGLYLADGKRLMENRTFLDHALPMCKSFEVYQGILDGEAKGIFNGKILVRPHAQKTDAKQSNRTLLLSEEATLCSKPQLEIYADDVKCTHGATSGHLDEEAIFYLRSRGLDTAEAKSLLIYGFAKAMIDTLKIEDLRSYLDAYLIARFRSLASPLSVR